MRIDLSKTSHILFFVILIPAFSILGVLVLHHLLSYVLQPISSTWYIPVIDTVGGIGAYSLLYGLFSKYLWKLSVFRQLGIVECPNLEGSWKGYLQSSYDHFKKKYSCVLEITQSFSSITACMYFDKSSSVSLIADFVKERNGDMALHFEYANDPNETAEETMHIHYGVAKLIYYPDSNKIKGSYYNSGQHDRGNWGMIELNYVGEDKVHKL